MVLSIAEVHREYLHDEGVNMTEKRKSIWEQIIDQKDVWIGGSFGEHDGICGDSPVGVIGNIRLEKSKNSDDILFYVDGAKDSPHEGFMVNIAYVGFGPSDVPEDKISIYPTYSGGDMFWMQRRKT